MDEHEQPGTGEKQQDLAGKPEPGPMLKKWLEIRETTRNPPEWGRRGVASPGGKTIDSTRLARPDASEAIPGTGEPGGLDRG